MAAPGIVVHERSGRWVARLRRELPTGLRITATRRAADCLAALAAAPGNAVLLEMDASVDTWAPDLELMRAVRRCDGGSVVIVIIPPGSEHLEVPAREFGAVHVSFDPLCWEPIVQILARHLDRSATANPANDALDLLEGIIDG